MFSSAALMEAILIGTVSCVDIAMSYFISEFEGVIKKIK